MYSCLCMHLIMKHGTIWKISCAQCLNGAMFSFSITSGVLGSLDLVSCIRWQTGLSCFHLCRTYRNLIAHKINHVEEKNLVRITSHGFVGHDQSMGLTIHSISFICHGWGLVVQMDGQLIFFKCPWPVLSLVSFVPECSSPKILLYPN